MRKSFAEIAVGAAVVLAAAVFLFYAVGHSGRSSGGGYTLTADFDRIDGLPQGADVRISGVKVGTVETQALNYDTFQAVLTFRVDRRIKLPDDSSAEIQSESLLGGKFVALVPGGSEKIIPEGGRIRLTQSAMNLEQLIGRFIFGGAPGGEGHGSTGQGSTGQGAAPTRPGG
ncbi:MAG: outer membrane lipid asymmetry maintenance protein MlaD [Acetobacteraceae bacterium]|nr:outer membrane lipid asymmetry maintenance protein MlaD [Acetobacteraceae bacterium]